MSKFLLALLALIATLSLSFNAYADTTYSFDVSYFGTFTELETPVLDSLGNVIGYNYDNTSALQFMSLNSGDPSLFSRSLFSQSKTYFDDSTKLLSCISCTFRETAKNGDTYFGTYTIDSYFDYLDLIPGESGYGNAVDFIGKLTITGGTGIFAGAVGSGTYYALDDYNNFTEYQKSVVSFTVPATPVPEPETYAMLVAGLGIVSFVTRRRRVS